MNIKLSYEVITEISKRTQSFSDLSDAEKALILEKYSPIGDQQKWIEWVLLCRSKNVCPNR